MTKNEKTTESKMEGKTGQTKWKDENSKTTIESLGNGILWPDPMVYMSRFSLEWPSSFPSQRRTKKPLRTDFWCHGGLWLDSKREKGGRSQRIQLNSMEI